MEPANEEKLASVSNLVTVFENSRTPGTAPRDQDQPPAPGPWEKPHVGETPESGPRTVSRRCLSSLKNKLSSGAWRRPCQPGTCEGTVPQEPEEKRVVRELLETEQAYVARLHLLDQASGQHPWPSTSVPCPPPPMSSEQG